MLLRGLKSERTASRFIASVGVAALALLCPLSAYAATTYYVAPDGKDTAAGSQAAPWASIGHAQTMAVAGDTVYFRAGKYTYTSGLTTCSSGTDTINAILLNKSGQTGAPIRYFAYPGETPVFDFSGIKDSCRVTGFRVTGSFLYLEGLEVMGVPQNNMLNHESWGIWISGSSNTFERINTHNHMGPGLFIQDGKNNLVLNCDSHDNYDPLTSNGAGQSADGFGCHVSAGGTGNVFRGCRAWWNSDDGWDFIQAAEVVTVENSWAWYNGYLPGTTTSAPAGNGNGFKGGGYGEPPTKVPASPPSHVIVNDLSVLNKESGFYANHEPAPDDWYNDTAYGNHPDFDLLGDPANVGILRNDIALGGTLLSNDTGAGIDESFNSWDAKLGVTVSVADFQSVSVTGLDSPRQADGSLPVLPNFHLTPGSDLIDKGTNVGLPFNGAAPDLGCFETGPALGGAGGASGAPGAGAAAGASSTASAGTAGGGMASGGTTSASVGGTPNNGGAANGGSPGESAGGIGSTAGVATSSGASTNGGAIANAGTTNAVTGGTSSEADSTAPNSAAGCSCRLSDRTASPRTGWLFVLLGLALVRPIRRRRARR